MYFDILSDVAYEYDRQMDRQADRPLALARFNSV